MDEDCGEGTRRNVANAFLTSLEVLNCNWAKVNNAAVGFFALVTAASNASSHCFGCFARNNNAARIRLGCSELGNSLSNVCSNSLH